MNDETLNVVDNEELTEGEAGVKVEKTDELLETFEDWIAEGVSEDDIIVKLHEDHGLTFPQAVNRFRKLKSQAGLTSPRGNKAEEVVAFIKDKHEGGMERSDIIAAMVEKFGYTPKSAASTFSVQGKKLGLTGEGTAGAKVPLEDVVKFLRENDGMDKAELLSKMQENLGYAASTCNAFYVYIPMAKEWAKQELEANG